MYKDIDEAIEKYKKIAEDERYNQALARNDDMFWNEKACEKIADEYSQIAEWLEELKELRELKDTYAKGMETSYSEFRYQQGRADAINAIKNDLHGKLVEEQNKPYPDGSLCLGYYNSIKICDWYLNDNKECEE